MNEIQSYYFQLKTAVLDGNLKRAKIFIGILSKFPEKEITVHLHPEWYTSYVIIKENIKYEVLMDLPPVKDIEGRDYKGGEQAKSQDALVDMILKDPGPLRSVLGITKPGILRPEFPTTNGERVDILTDQKWEIRFPVEIKIDRADHETIGQIRKYCNYFWKQLSYGFYYRVQGVVLANVFDAQTMRELKRDGMWTVAYSLTDSGASFVRL